MSFNTINERLSKILLGPLVSEKATHIGDKENATAFWVKPDATKHEIKAAVEKYFPKAKVQSVRTLVTRRAYIRFANRTGRMKRQKKAYVQLVPGTEINFEEMV